MTLESCMELRGWASKNPSAAECLDRMRKRMEKRVPTGAFSLTRLQQMAIDTPAFWRDWQNEDDPQNLMIQGATSAGKTLLAELAALDTLVNSRQVIFLVPLKSMVNERRRQFSEDLGEDLPSGHRVYAASGDYMEYDERLIRGDYEVAVIVYEKFFAMLSQGGQKIMENCGLLVVDELAMLSKEQRGPKLEMALEIVRTSYPETRIMCLGTCDCKVEHICKWLNIDEAHRIFSAARPVALEEHILLLNGSGRYRTIPADLDILPPVDEQPVLEECLKIPGYQEDWRIPEKKKHLLQAVLKELVKRDGTSRILIFVSSKKEASNIAAYLKDNMQEAFPRISGRAMTEEFDSFVQQLQNCEEDEGQADLIQNLIPYGIAYHHAGLSTTLRELIEDEFQRQNSFLRLIVATETLTIGVNMPFDAMIMLSSRVPRGEGDPVRLSQQEYRNFIGRAGRLGQSNRPGITYLFLEEKRDLSFFWNSYNNQEEVESALVKADETALAPYYLSLLMKSRHEESFDEEQILEMFDRSLPHVCRPGKGINASELCDALYEAYMIDEGKAESKGRSKRQRKVYAVVTFGTHMAPYAFSTDTCIKIYEAFYDGRGRCALPGDVTSLDIDSDRYLLDILYHVCRHEEIENTSVLAYPKDNNRPDRVRSLKTAVIRHLQLILNEKDPEGNPLYELWPSVPGDRNELDKLMNDINLGNESLIAQAALRAILLFYWTQGLTIKELKKKSGLSTYLNISGGDIERLAEVASFHLDAIGKSLGSNTQYISDLNVPNSFYSLQCRVKYGMSRDLVRLANKHVHGLDRNRLLLLGKAAEEKNMSPTAFLYYEAAEAGKYLTAMQRNGLMAALERRGEAGGLDDLLDLLYKETGKSLTPRQWDGIKHITDSENQNADDLYEAIRDAVEDNELLPGIRIRTDGRSSNVVWQSRAGEEICIGLLPDPDEESGIADLRKFFERASAKGQSRLLLVHRTGSSGDWANTLENVGKACACATVFDTDFFALILAHTILKSLNSDDPLSAFLKDARGVFTSNEYRYYSPENYIHHKESVSEAQVLIVCGKNRSAYANHCIVVSDLLAQLERQQIRHSILSWSDAPQLLEKGELLSENAVIILMLEREMVVRSRDLASFIYSLNQLRFPRTLLILSSEDSQKRWECAERIENQGETWWSPDYCSVEKVVLHDTASACRMIQEYLRSRSPEEFLVGISYAHDDSFSGEDRPAYASDIELLKQVADGLKQIYGEHRILFDRYAKAGKLFNQNEARQASLNAYRSCKLSLILWNDRTRDNVNCRYEREAIFAGGGRYIYLLPAGAPDLPDEKDFYLKLNKNSVQSIIQEVVKNLPQP